eukprot:GHVR01154933.1.p2 GENE.GHVR01154933.1~~GHVR01154933.1.p2  ORF type:complete len:113 (+),score=17.60 GHVR01154933.1:217-555(+)
MERLDVVKVLVENGVDVNFRNNVGQCALHNASANGHLYVVKYLIENGAYINNTDNEGDTPVYIASWNGHIEVVRYLLNEGGADVNTKNENNEKGRAVCKDELEILLLLQLLI